MRIRFVLATVIFVLCGACAAPQQQPQQPAEPQPEFRLTGTIKDIMDSVIDPSADYVWDAVATTFDATGVHEKAPRTDEEWKEVRRHTIRLLEGTNLLQMPGRLVAKPHEKSENPGIELEPEEMQKLVDQDKESFYKLAQALHESVLPVLKAIDAKDKEALLDAGDEIDQACENCHLKYWYPNEARPPQADIPPLRPPEKKSEATK